MFNDTELFQSWTSLRRRALACAHDLRAASKDVIVVGAAGEIGSRLVAALARLDVPCTAVDIVSHSRRTISRMIAQSPESIVIFCNTVVHNRDSSGRTIEDARLFRYDIESYLMYIHALHRTNRVLFLSSGKVYADHGKTTMYGTYKRVIETLFVRAIPDVTVFRLNFVVDTDRPTSTQYRARRKQLAYVSEEPIFWSDTDIVVASIVRYMTSGPMIVDVYYNFKKSIKQLFSYEE